MARTAFAVLILAVVSAEMAAAQEPAVSVADLIGMTLFGSDPHNGGSEADAHELSPDGAHVAVVLQRGDVATNTVHYALVVFPTADLKHTARPDTLVTIASGSNGPAISDVRWLSDNRTLAFLGERPGEPAQVYTVDTETHTVTARSHSTTGVTTFEIAPAGDPVIYQQHGTVDTSRYAAMRAHGFVLSPKAWLTDAIAGDWLDSGPKFFAVQYPKGYRILRQGRDGPLELPDSGTGVQGCEVRPDFGPPLGADGGSLMLLCRPRTRPAAWELYRNPRYRLWIDKFGDYGQVLVRLDLRSGEAHLVSTAPVPDEASFVWAPDGRTVIVANALLPLTGPDSARRLTQRMAAEIDLRTGGITVVAQRDSLVVQRWDARTGLVDFAAAVESDRVTRFSPHRYFRKTTRGWTEVAGAPRVVIDQGPNTPPRLAVVDPTTRNTRIVFDPNPDLLTNRRFARAEVFHWTSKNGNAFVGGLYSPPDYVPGRRYPLVIQTHGYDSTRFAPYGVFTTDEAAQPLANAGIFVLQTFDQVGGPRMVNEMETPNEGPFVQDAFEGAIDALDRRGVIDRSKIGLQAFSRTCFYTLFFLTHSSYPVAAADIADGVDYGYLQHLVWGGDGKIDGGQPWGAGQAQWLERAAGFRLDRVTAPLRVTAIQPYSLLQEWEPYAGLRLLGKPTELVYIPDGVHVLVKPWERLTSQQGAVDWWRFWLQGYEDPDSSKAEQYVRWHKLRAQRDSSAVSSTSSR